MGFVCIPENMAWPLDARSLLWRVVGGLAGAGAKLLWRKRGLKLDEAET
jgi:hypothetical protein